MKNLTDRQREVLNYIAQFTEDNVYPPTVREIGEHFGVSLRAVQDHLSALQKKGYISLTQKKSRSIRVLLDERGESPVPAEVSSWDETKIPVLGTVAAGKPILSEENLDGYINLSETFIKPGKSYYAMHVRGRSMIDAGILEGDIAVLEHCEDAMDGQIVLAVVDEGITLKRFYRETNRIRLQPENSQFQPIYCQEVRIVGVLAGILRKY